MCQTRQFRLDLLDAGEPAKGMLTGGWAQGLVTDELEGETHGRKF